MKRLINPTWKLVNFGEMDTSTSKVVLDKPFNFDAKKIYYVNIVSNSLGSAFSGLMGKVSDYALEFVTAQYDGEDSIKCDLYINIALKETYLYFIEGESAIVYIYDTGFIVEE